jgi:hypothetical protein
MSFNECYLNSGLPHVTNFTLTDVSWLSDYLDSENRLIVASSNGSLINNSTYMFGEFPKDLQVRSGLRNDDGSVTARFATVRGVYITSTGRSLRRKHE